MLEVALAIPYWLELAATIAGAIFGALSAVRAKYDIFGVCCIAIVVGLAGGITRDILLQDYGIYAFQKPNLILACIAAGIVAFYFGKLMTYFDPFMDLLDNLSVALWAIIGTGKALSAGLDLVPAVILGTITANGGGIVRDICMNREPEAFQAGTVYVSAAFIGALAFAVMKQNHLLDQYAAITCVVLVMGIRYASLAFGWRTRPARDYSDVVTQAVAQPVKRMANRMRARRRPTGFQAQTTGLTSVVVAICFALSAFLSPDPAGLSCGARPAAWPLSHPTARRRIAPWATALPAPTARTAAIRKATTSPRAPRARRKGPRRPGQRPAEACAAGPNQASGRVDPQGHPTRPPAAPSTSARPAPDSTATPSAHAGG